MLDDPTTDTSSLPWFDVKARNWIAADFLPDRSAVKLTIVLGGKPAAWIEYNAEQLDDLIRLLETCRQDLL